MKFLITIATIFISSIVFAKTDVNQQLEKLRVNHVNSSENYRNYKDNYDISINNVNEIKSALKSLKKFKKDLKYNDQNIANNKRVLTKMSEKFSDYIADENEKIEQENKQISDLNSLIEKIQKNKDQRSQNIVAYEAKIAEIKDEIASWDLKNRDIASIKEQLLSKEQAAIDSLKEWTNKKDDYKKEALKWNKKATILNKTYVRIKRLNE